MQAQVPVLLGLRRPQARSMAKSCAAPKRRGRPSGASSSGVNVATAKPKRKLRQQTTEEYAVGACAAHAPELSTHDREVKEVDGLSMVARVVKDRRTWTTIIKQNNNNNNFIIIKFCFYYFLFL